MNELFVFCSAGNVGDFCSFKGYYGAGAHRLKIQKFVKNYISHFRSNKINFCNSLGKDFNIPEYEENQSFDPKSLVGSYGDTLLRDHPVPIICSLPWRGKKNQIPAVNTITNNLRFKFPPVTPCYPLLPLVTTCYPLLLLVTPVTTCYPCYPLLPLFTVSYPVVPLLPFLTPVTPVTPCYPLLLLVTTCYPLLLLVTSVTTCYPC